MNGTVMITGATRGLGLELARQYAAADWRVIAAARNPDAAEELAVIDGKVTVHKLDIADGEAVLSLSDELAAETIDVLINNAGISAHYGTDLGTIDYDAWQEALAVNLMGPVRVAEAFVEQVARAKRGRMIFMSSRAGSIGDNISGGRYLYRTSKAALNMAVRSLAVDLQDRGIISTAVHPGWIRTDMGGETAPLDAATAAQALRHLIDRLEVHDSGRFLKYDGTAVVW